MFALIIPSVCFNQVFSFRCAFSYPERRIGFVSDFAEDCYEVDCMNLFVIAADVRIFGSKNNLKSHHFALFKLH